MAANPTWHDSGAALDPDAALAQNPPRRVAPHPFVPRYPAIVSDGTCAQCARPPDHAMHQVRRAARRFEPGRTQCYCLGVVYGTHVLSCPYRTWRGYRPPVTR
jgi:hypothetical protein